MYEMEQHRADYVESKETGKITGTEEQKNVMIKAVCEAVGQKVRVLGCLETLLLDFSWFEMSQMSLVQVGQDT